MDMKLKKDQKKLKKVLKQKEEEEKRLEEEKRKKEEEEKRLEEEKRKQEEEKRKQEEEKRKNEEEKLKQEEEKKKSNDPFASATWDDFSTSAQSSGFSSSPASKSLSFDDAFGGSVAPQPTRQTSFAAFDDFGANPFSTPQSAANNPFEDFDTGFTDTQEKDFEGFDKVEQDPFAEVNDDSWNAFDKSSQDKSSFDAFSETSNSENWAFTETKTTPLPTPAAVSAPVASTPTESATATTSESSPVVKDTFEAPMSWDFKPEQESANKPVTTFQTSTSSFTSFDDAFGGSTITTATATATTQGTSDPFFLFPSFFLSSLVFVVQYLQAFGRKLQKNQMSSRRLQTDPMSS